MRDAQKLTEDQRWEAFARELAMLLDGLPGHVEGLVEVVRHPEARDAVFTWAIQGVFPRLTVEKRRRLAQFMHVLES